MRTNWLWTGSISIREWQRKKKQRINKGRRRQRQTRGLEKMKRRPCRGSSWGFASGSQRNASRTSASLAGGEARPLRGARGHGTDGNTHPGPGEGGPTEGDRRGFGKVRLAPCQVMGGAKKGSISQRSQLFRLPIWRFLFILPVLFDFLAKQQKGRSLQKN